MLTIQQLLNLHNNRLSDAKVKLVRHKDSRAEYREVIKDRSALLNYQSEQGSDIFKDCDYIVSFIGIERRRSVFIGVFSISGSQKRGDKYYYDIEAVPGYEDLEDRVVIDWGASARGWHQWYHRQEKEVVEILPKGYLGGFPGLLDFVLDYNELKKLAANPEANADWYHHLSSVNGIYLILDSSTGMQYIGAAYGEKGIWGRWSEYARTPSGGNVELARLLGNDSGYHRHFRYSVLQTLPSNVNAKEVVAVEALYKEKLGSRVHGLNQN